MRFIPHEKRTKFFVNVSISQKYFHKIVNMLEKQHFINIGNTMWDIAWMVPAGADVIVIVGELVIVAQLAKRVKIISYNHILIINSCFSVSLKMRAIA